MRKEMMEHLEEMVIKVEKGIPFSRGRDSKYEEYFSTIDGMNIGDSFEVFDIRTWDAVRQYQYTPRFSNKNKHCKLVTKRYTNDKYRVWKLKYS